MKNWFDFLGNFVGTGVFRNWLGAVATGIVNV